MCIRPKEVILEGVVVVLKELLIHKRNKKLTIILYSVINISVKANRTDLVSVTFLYKIKQHTGLY